VTKVDQILHLPDWFTSAPFSSFPAAGLLRGSGSLDQRKVQTDCHASRLPRLFDFVGRIFEKEGLDIYLKTRCINSGQV